MSEAVPYSRDSEEFNRAVSHLAGATSEELSRTTTPDRGDGSPSDAQQDEDIRVGNAFFDDDTSESEATGRKTVVDASGGYHEDELTEEVGPTRADRFYEKLGSMLPPEGSIKRGLKNFMQTAGVGVAAYIANKYGGDVISGIIDGAEWLAREGADLAVSIGSAAWEGAQGIAGAVKNVASNANPVYFGAGVANGIMRGAMDSDPANDNKRNLITGAIMGTALAHGANPGAPEAVSFAAGHLVGSKGRKLVSAAGRAASGAATKLNAGRLSGSSAQPEQGVVTPVVEPTLEHVDTDNRAEGVEGRTEENQNADMPAVDTTPKPSRREATKQARSDWRANKRAAFERGRVARTDKHSGAARRLVDSVE